MQQILDKALEEGRKKIEFGKTAAYMPELLKVDKNYLGICIHTRDGKRYKSGDADMRFTIQSISKVISLAVALECCGHEKIFEQIASCDRRTFIKQQSSTDGKSNLTYLWNV